jgi:hypothetical protein
LNRRRQCLENGEESLESGEGSLESGEGSLAELNCRTFTQVKKKITARPSVAGTRSAVGPKL